MKLETGYEVEWCSHIPKYEDGSADIDGAVYHVRDFPDKESAMTFARSVLPKDAFGSVRVVRFWSEPYEEDRPNGPKFREHGDPEYVEE